MQDVLDYWYEARKFPDTTDRYILAKKNRPDGYAASVLNMESVMMLELRALHARWMNMVNGAFKEALFQVPGMVDGPAALATMGLDSDELMFVGAFWVLFHFRTLGKRDEYAEIWCVLNG